MRIRERGEKREREEREEKAKRNGKLSKTAFWQSQQGETMGKWKKGEKNERTNE